MVNTKKKKIGKKQLPGVCIHLIDDLKKGNIAIFLIFTAKGRETQRVISASLTTSLKIYVFSFFPLLTLLDCSSK